MHVSPTARLSSARFYAILDTGYVPRARWRETCAALIAGGAGLVQVRAKRDAGEALPQSAEIGGPGLAAAEAAPQPPAPPRLPDWIDDAKSAGAAQAETVRNVGGLIVENPKQAALIVRDWLSSAA